MPYIHTFSFILSLVFSSLFCYLILLSSCLLVISLLFSFLLLYVYFSKLKIEGKELKMFEILISIAAKVAEYLVAPMAHPFTYFRNCKRNLENLKNEVEKLMDARERVQHRVDDAKRNGEEIEQSVEKWLNEVSKITDKAGKLIEKEEKAQKRCFKGFCSNLKTRYKVSKKASRELKLVARFLQEEGKFGRVSYRTIPEYLWLTSIKGYEAFESRMSTLKDILNALSDSNVNMVGVYGMGGVGKTTLVKEVARQAKKDKLFDVVVFTCVSHNQDIKRIQGEIADKLGLKFSEESESGRARRLFERLRKEKKILVILDDLCASLDLEAVGIPCADDHKGCKVLLTARTVDVLSNEMDSQNNFMVDILNEEESWNLFKKMAGDCTEDCDLKSTAIGVAKACNGLPIALVTVARVLRYKNVTEWENALRALRRPSSS